MKKTIIAVAAILLSMGAVAFLKYEKVENTAYTLPDGFTLTAHTGCENTEDNSLESISAAILAKADIVEVDLHFTDEGVPVMCHDEPKGDDCVTLEAAFDLLSKHDVRMNVDVKSTKNIPAVLALAKKYAVTDKIFFTGVEEKFVASVSAGAPEVPYFLNVAVDKKKNTDTDYLAELVKKVKDCKAIGINMNFKGCSKELVAAFRKEGLLVSLWTANSKNQIYRCLNFEPDNITTRKPSLFWSVLNKE